MEGFIKSVALKNINLGTKIRAKQNLLGGILILAVRLQLTSRHAKGANILSRGRMSMMSKPDTSKVIPTLARQALKLAGGDRKAAFSRYIEVHYRNTGRIAPGCDNRDLQAFYDKEVERNA